MLKSVYLRIALGLMLGMLTTLGGALAETPAGNAPQAQPGKPAHQPAALPDPVRMNILIRDAIIALNHANQTGNYTVLRDLGTPAFQQMNDPARIGIAFTTLRAKNSDFSPVFFINPVLVQQPSLDPNGVLRLLGYFPTQPQRIVFDVSFQQSGGRWRLASLVADIQPAPAAVANAANPPATPPPAAPKKTEEPKPALSKPAAALKKPAAPAKPPEKKPEEKHAASVPPAPEPGNAKADDTVKIDLFGEN